MNHLPHIVCFVYNAKVFDLERGIVLSLNNG